MSEENYKVRTPWFRTYSEVRMLLTLLQGVSRAAVKSMASAIEAQMGTPQNPVDWSEPDTWIAERLQGNDAKLAQHIWQGSHNSVSPRYIAGALFLMRIYDLLIPDIEDIYSISERGRLFLENDPQTVREIDETEGILQLLTILATKIQAKRSDLLPEWGEFLHAHSKFGTELTIKDSLRRRIVNVVERGLVLRIGNSYKISPEGLSYITSGTSQSAKITLQEVNPRREVMLAVEAFNTKKKKELREQLKTMHPYRFEHLVCDLLEAMGYEDVTVTKASGDYGVDVVATVQFGITTITEVIQVKRRQDSINRPILDQLRGALPYYKALRGTIITLGTFSSGCVKAALFVGAAPIGLIDGDKLLDLLIKYEIGMKNRPLNLYDIDEEYLRTTVESHEEEISLQEELE
ncbi:MAG: restriction endonuclease [Ktedonobacteraceae bacterium]